MLEPTNAYAIINILAFKVPQWLNVSASQGDIEALSVVFCLQ